MEKADKQTWNDTWNKLKGDISINDVNRIIFRELSNVIDFRGKETIELGCGKGILSYLMMKNGAKSCALVDFSESALSLARTLFGDAKNVNFILSDVFKIDETKQYDIVFSSGVAEHFSDALREEIIHKHLRLTKDIAVLIVPARPHYNTIRHRKRKVVALYGWQYAFSKKEINNIVNKGKGFDIVLSQRIYPLYGLNLSGLFVVNDKTSIFRGWNIALDYLDKVFSRIGLFKVIDLLLLPLSRYTGGLLITIIKKSS